jgi:hypothetical protein
MRTYLSETSEIFAEVMFACASFHINAREVHYSQNALVKAELRGVTPLKSTATSVGKWSQGELAS